MSAITAEGPAPASLLQFPFPRVDTLSPPPAYSDFRAEDALKKVRLFDGRSVWLATRYDDVRTILSDARFSANPRGEGYPFLSPTRTSIANEPPMLNHFDAPQHTALRRVLTREFMATRIESMRPRVEQIVQRCLDEMVEKGPPADFVETFALPIPSTVIAEMLGVPYQDHEFFQDRAKLRLSTEGDPNIPIVAGQEMADYFDSLFLEKDRTGNEGDDIVSRLARDHVATGNLSREQAVRMCALLLQAGHETTGNMISLGTLTLLRNRDQLQRIIADPTLVPQAVEEMLRYLSIVHFHTPRSAIDDVEVAGQVIKAGEGVYALISSANRDEKSFPQADTFDIDRKARHHVAFSYGVHQCLGQPLARMELQSVFSMLFQQLPKLDLAVPPETLRFKDDSLVYGIYEMPMTW
jgi:cytochrome P450